MTTQTLQTTGTAAMPRVNLMPPEIGQAERFRQIQIGLGAAVVAAIAIVAALYWNAHSAVSSAKDELAAAQAQNTTLTAQLRSLDSVKETFAAVQARQAMLTQAMGQEVRWSFVLNDLAFRIPNNVWLTGLTVTETPPAAAAPTGGSLTGEVAEEAAAAVPIGTITFSGVGLKHNDVAVWLDALAKQKNFLNPTFSTSTEAVLLGHPTVTFGSSVTLTSLALSHRYDAPAATTPTTSSSLGTTTP
jgi:Tfp pilus assembly protein PilN